MHLLRKSMPLLVLAAVTVTLIVVGGCPPAPEPDAGGAIIPPPGEGAETPGATLEGEPIKIGGIFDITGPASSLGVPERNTAQMLEDQINKGGGVNGRPIEIVIRDTKGDETQGINAVRELIDKENVVAIVGPSRSGTTLGIIDTVTNAEIPLVSCAASRKITEPTKKWVFSTPQSDTDAVAKIYEYLSNEGITKVALLTASSGYGISGLEQLKAQAPDAGIEIVAEEQFADTDTDMNPQLTRIRGTNAEVVIVWGVGKAPALIAKQMKQLDIEAQLIQSHGVANRDFINNAGDAAEGVILPAGKLLVAEQLPDDDPQKELLLEYASDYEERFGERADTFGGHCWDAVMLVVNAIRENGPTPAEIRDGIENTTGFLGIGGEFNFSEDAHYGLSPDAFVMVRIEDGDWTLIE